MFNKEGNVLDKIFMVYENLYEAEKKIADYVIENQQKVIDMTVSELSSESGVSEATIIRFCKKCNFKGFHHLKMEIAKEMVTSEEKKVSNDLSTKNIGQSLQNILANKIEELRQTISMMDENNMREILDIISKARIVQFAALGNTIPVILDGAYKFSQIGIPTVANTIWENQLAFAYTLTAEDVVIAVSNSGSSKRLITLVEVANEKQAKTICITNHENSPLANKCKYKINTATREKLFFDEFSFTRISAMVVVEILFLLLVSEKGDAYNRLSEHEGSMADDKI
ncbi:RpiR family transcriptional regulator [Clostridium pasteurianum DSM 525 = ATCC 6013]|uniref:RpiR family transcriptional regulator n=1 Tax=Clostridium pasteurianum DSM 525 = ATCC 6013 TaxID=1262449 RepID=A0A0H3J4W8_CLOPA|nr:MurR/RpiR family transcriptional regulator [Clostridium pasteurianum]AJA48961.1 RpiR family transcriptional regulator [Clostridium pasteurianum DSM 525 = ATCC 6013]AJA52949.1 RpiR family transcriptional regulator [Clostridium pasteurianum DSM 525 = ATCC 6013]AOZ76168.1 RpiR family transcriptional regulator [Clostridium pasteurianum DSM 525 = ATCC 6013]AOZ79964.1 RpiR family transcriptional regulator [Clostridium pasteurianum]ELP60257.1 RpiR family transcriptional regulator [Clostridium past